MSPELARAGFRIAMFLIVTSGVLLLLITPGNPEFYAALFTIIIGGVLIGVILLLERFL